MGTTPRKCLLFLASLFFLRGSLPRSRRRLILSKEFPEMVSSAGFEDKTSLIFYFLTSEERHWLLTAPRGFGKRLNADMLHKFVERPLDVHGQDDAPRRDQLARLFAEGGLAIVRLFQAVVHAFLAHPVLHLDFATLDASSYDAFRRSFSDLLRREVRRHQYLTTANWTAALCQRYRNIADSARQLPAGATAQLAQLLRKYHDKQVILFVDDYDMPLVAALENPRCTDGDFRKMVTFLDRLFKRLMDCGHLDRSLLTGCSFLGRTITRSAGNLLYLRNLDQPGIAKYYGFSAPHVESLATTFRRGAEMDRLRRWYDRYRVEGTYSVFSPRSVLHYFQFDKFRPYNDYERFPLQAAFKFDEISDLVEKSLSHLVQVEAIIDTTFLEIEDLIALRRYLNHHEVNPRRAKLYTQWFLQHLLDHGFYTINNTIEESTAVEIRVTNRERGLQLRNALYTRSFLKRKYSITDLEIEAYLSALVRLTKDRNELFVKFMNATKSLLEKPTVKLEKDMFLILYHAITSHEARLFQRWGGQNRVYKAFSRKKLKAAKANWTEADSRWVFHAFSRVKWSRKRRNRVTAPKGAFTVLDIYVVTKDRVGIIIELKYDKTTAFRALEQIVDSQYYKIFSKNPPLPWALRSQVYIGMRYHPVKGALSMSYLYNSKSLKKAVNITTIVPKVPNKKPAKKKPKADLITRQARTSKYVELKGKLATAMPTTAFTGKVPSLIRRIVSKLNIFRSKTTLVSVSTPSVTQVSRKAREKRRRAARTTVQPSSVAVNTALVQAPTAIGVIVTTAQARRKRSQRAGKVPNRTKKTARNTKSSDALEPSSFSWVNATARSTKY